MGVALTLRLLSVLMAIPTAPSVAAALLMNDWFQACDASSCCINLKKDFSDEKHVWVVVLSAWSCMFLIFGTIYATLSARLACYKDFSVLHSRICVGLFAVSDLLLLPAILTVATNMDEVRDASLLSVTDSDFHDEQLKNLRKFFSGGSASNQQTPDVTCDFSDGVTTFHFGLSYKVLWIGFVLGIGVQLCTFLASVMMKLSKERQFDYRIVR